MNETIVNSDNDSKFLMEYEGAQLLNEFDIPVVDGELARNKSEALKIASYLGYPIVLKGMSRQAIHKTEAGLVKLNIQNDAELEQAYIEIENNIAEYNQDAKLEGILVQKMAPKGIELILGIKKDPVFGHQLIIGLGGIWVEVMKDFAIKMMPVSDLEVDEMLKSLKGYTLLNGYRGNEKINVELLKNMVNELNTLVEQKPEIEEMDLNPVIFTSDQSYICDVRILLEAEKVSESGLTRSLDHIDSMLNPKSIAVVGASANYKKNGARLFRYIVENGYKGNLFPINPKADEIMGYKAYPSILEVKEEIDLACIIIASEHVPNVLEDCITKGIKSAIIYSSGFAEAGVEGEKLQEKICEIAIKGNIRLLGPNSIGIASPSQNIYTAFGAALESKIKVPGSIGFVSQSGAMGSALLSRAWEEGAGFSRWVSVANEADLTTSDFIKILAEDQLTKVISVFLEGIKDVDSFKTASMKALEYKKPIIVYKTGKSTVGKRAVQSHTGSIAGDDMVYSSAFEKMGVLRANNIEELIDVSRAFEVQNLPNGKRIGVITASGGACSVVADLCEENGLDVPDLSEKSEEIKQLIPPFGSAKNPVDVTAEVIAKPEMFKKILDTLAEDSHVDGIIVMLTTNADPGAVVIAEAILDVYKNQNKPIVLGRLGAHMIAPKAMELYRKEKFPVYPTPERAVRVMNYLVKYNEILQR